MPDVFDTLTESSTGQDIFDLVGNDSPTPETDKALADQGGILSRLNQLAKTPSPQFLQPFEQRAKAFVQGAGVPGSLEEVKQFVTRNPIQDIKDIYTDVSKIPERVRNIGQTLQTSPAATVARAPLSPEAFQVYGTTAAMLAPAVIKARETPVARPEGETVPTTPRGVEPATAATTEATGAVPEQPLTQAGGEVTDAQQRSNAQVQGGTTALGVEARPEGEVPIASNSDNVVGETSGEKPVVEGAPPQEDVAVTPQTTLEENSGLVNDIKRITNPETGGFTRGGDYVRSVMKDYDSDELINFIKWSRSNESTPYIARFGGDYAADILRQRGVPVDQIEWQITNLGGSRQGLLSFASGKKSVAVTQPGGGDEPATAAVSGAETPPAAEPPVVGISQARTEAELGAGSVEPGVGAEMGSGLEYGRNYINKGGDPRLPIRRAKTSGLVGKNEVGIVHAELERLRAERARAAQAFEANPDDPLLAAKLEDADSAQREWRKELQPVLTKASDALREAYAASVPEADPATYQGLADIFDEHFKGERDITPEMRTEMAKAAKGYREVRDSANAEFGKIEQELTKRIRGKKVMTPGELDADLRSVLEDAFKDCVLS